MGRPTFVSDSGARPGHVSLRSAAGPHSAAVLSDDVYVAAVYRGRTSALVGALLVSVLLSACGESGGNTAAATENEATSTTVPCGPEQDDCTEAQVTETVAQIYEIGGATASEAACLAPITSSGRHAVNEAFDVPRPGETEAAIGCAGSATRLRAITAGVAEYFTHVVLSRD